MPLFTHDMSSIQAMDGSNVPEGWYHVRIEKGEVRDSKETPGEQVWWIWHKAQNEPFVGRIIMDKCSLQPSGLGKLKVYYEKAGYKPGAEGHDPDNITTSEFYVKVEDTIYKGDHRIDIKPWNIRSLDEGLPPGAKLAS